MSNFMAFNQQKAQELTERLSKTIFKTPHDFVNFYNSGMINKKFGEVKGFVDEIVATYRDVEERNGLLVFISKQEVFLDELNRVLADWGIITKVRRELDGLIAAGTVSETDEIAFVSTAPGLIAVRQGEGDEFAVVGTEKMFTRHADIEDVYRKYSSKKDTSDSYAFMVTDFTSLDDSFIEKMMEVAPRR